MRLALTSTDPVAISITTAIHSGDVAALRQLLSDDPGLPNARIVGADGVQRSMLPWLLLGLGVFRTSERRFGPWPRRWGRQCPGCHHPKDPNCVETPHWAASSNDVAAIDAGLLTLRHGGDLQGGVPRSDAVMFANWEAAPRLDDYPDIRNLAQPRFIRVTPVELTTNPGFQPQIASRERGATLRVLAREHRVLRLGDIDVRHDAPGVFSPFKDLGTALSADGTNVFMVKMNYWLGLSKHTIRG